MEHYLRHIVPEARSVVSSNPFLGGLPEMSISIMKYVKDGDYMRIAAILQACCQLATKQAHHLLFEFTCANPSELGGEVEFALKLLPRFYFETPEPAFLWAMAIGKDNALAAALLRDGRVTNPDSRQSPLFVTHVVARGLQCSSAEKLRTLFLQALAVPLKRVRNNSPWVEIIGRWSIMLSWRSDITFNGRCDVEDVFQCVEVPLVCTKRRLGGFMSSAGRPSPCFLMLAC